MKRNIIYLLMVVLVLAFSSSSWAQFPCYPGDLAESCCGADSGLWGYSWDLGFCDTLHVIPWPHTDTCFGDTCINRPGENFPCFMYVNLFVTHDSNTFWWEDQGMWIQDSIAAFVVPLTFWHQSTGDADSVIFPNWDNWNNTIINPYDPRMNRSMFRHFVDSHTGDTVYYNRLLQMVETWKGAWNVYTDIESHSSDGDSGHVFFSILPLQPNCQRWWEGERVLLTTLTLQVYMSEDCDTTEICFDSTLWFPTSNLTFARLDDRLYCPRHFLPICFRVPAPEWLKIIVSPDNVDFDSVYVDSISDTVMVAITNYGTMDLEVYSISVSTGSFHLTDTSIYIIPPASSDTFKVNFAPSDTGLFEDTIRISSNADEGDSVVPLSGTGKYTGVRWIEDFAEEESKPITFSVSQNYPNPFNPVTNFEVALPKASHVKIEIFNILGQKVKTLVDEDMRAGVFIVDWDGKDKRGLEVSSGIYFYRIVAGEFSDIKKMIFLK